MSSYAGSQELQSAPNTSVRRNPLIDTNRSGLLVNVGCGHTRPRGWINTDSSLNSLFQVLFQGRTFLPLSRTVYDRPAKYMDLRRRWKFGAGTVEVLYASHVFEHLSIHDANHFLLEARRCLVPSGVLRMVVPDLHRLAQMYLEDVQSGDRAAAGRFLGAVNMHAESAYGPGRNIFIKVINQWQGYPHQHKYMYDERSLADLLTTAGFRNLQICHYGQSVYIQNIRDVECTAEGVPSIYIEANP